jgi:hypothetical protein
VRALAALVAVVVVAAAVLALARGGTGPVSSPLPSATRSAPALVPWDRLDRRWGTYLSEREWGNPREAVAGNGWGLGYLRAITADYRSGEDGIAGIETSDGSFHVSWAFWDGVQRHVTERLYGLTNAAGSHGETIAENRIFHENAPTHSYSRYEYHYPTVQPGPGQAPPVDTIDTLPGTFTIQLESAKVESAVMALRATVTNTSASAGRIDVVLKGWLDPGGHVLPVPAGIALQGPTSTVALVAAGPVRWQVSNAKDALDTNLRAGALPDAGSGYIGALDARLDLAPGAVATVDFAMAEVPGDDPARAADRARAILPDVGAVEAARRAEADRLFSGDVTAHQALYQQLLMDTLWSESHYRWDASAWGWSGTVAADDVLIMPDKWEFPWPASWDSGFQSVVASLIDPDLAKDQLRFLFSDRWQQPDGHVPCAEWVMADECPPVFAWSAWQIFERDHDQAFLRELYPGLERLYRYWDANMRDPAHPDLFTGGFQGMDNLPRAGSAEVDASGWMAFAALYMGRIAEQLDEGAAATAYTADRARISEAVNRSLWNDADAFYEDLGEGGEGFVRTRSYAGLVPLIAGIVPPDRQARLLDALRAPGGFLSAHGLRSVPADDPAYQPGYADAGGVNSNWLGPVWVPLNYLLIGALQPLDASLATQVRDRVVATVEADWLSTGHVHEYYDAETGRGLGADAQTGWTALVANLIREGWPAP